MDAFSGQNRCFDDVMVGWCDGWMVLWLNGMMLDSWIMVGWCDDVMVRWCEVGWHDGVMVGWCNSWMV